MIDGAKYNALIVEDDELSVALVERNFSFFPDYTMAKKPVSIFLLSNKGWPFILTQYC